MQLYQIIRIVLYRILLDMHNNHVVGLQILEMFFTYPNDHGHKGFLCCFKQVKGHVGNEHMSPFEREEHFHYCFNNKGIEVLVGTRKNDLFFLKDS